MHWIPWRISLSFCLLLASDIFSGTIGLENLIRMGISHNAELQVSQQATEILAQDTLATRVQPNPTLSFEALQNIAEPSKPKANVKISQEFRPGYRDNSNHASMSRFTAGREWQRSHELDLIRDIRSDFFTWQILNRKRALHGLARERWQALAPVARALANQGKISSLDEGQTRLNLAKAKQKEMEIYAAMESVEKHLGYLTGSGSLNLPDSLAIEVVDSLPDIPSLDSLLAWSASANPDLRAADFDLAARKDEMAVERNLRYSGFNLSLGYERETDGANLIGGGIEVPLPIFNRNQAGIAKAQASLRETELKKQSAQAKTQSELSEARGKLLSLAARYRNYRVDIQDLSRKQVNLSELGFRRGALGVFDLSRVQEDALNQDLEALNLLDEFYQLWNRLGRISGGKSW